jgi:hypothetical protein
MDGGVTPLARMHLTTLGKRATPTRINVCRGGGPADRDVPAAAAIRSWNGAERKS